MTAMAELTETAELPTGDDWIALCTGSLPVPEVLSWITRPDCGAFVLFCGTVRDHSEGRQGVVALEYEAYVAQVEPRLAALAVEIRRRWPELRRLALLHRTGQLEVGDVSVLVAASTPHRAEAFEAARYGIDTIKASVPIWKRETWQDGTDWATCSHDLVDVGDTPQPRPGRTTSSAR